MNCFTHIISISCCYSPFADEETGAGKIWGWKFIQGYIAKRSKLEFDSPPQALKLSHLGVHKVTTALFISARDCEHKLGVVAELGFPGPRLHNVN